MSTKNFQKMLQSTMPSLKHAADRTHLLSKNSKKAIIPEKNIEWKFIYNVR